MRRTAFTLPASLQREFTKHVVESRGYGPRGKSRWVREAIAMLFHEDPGLTQVGLGVDVMSKDAIEPVYLDERTEEIMSGGFRILRTQYPEWEGVQGDIIRAAVMYRLARDQQPASFSEQTSG
ncbi:MAG: hypothetical protein ACYDHY_15810 [Acidiferrobacterales bacterium]